MQQSLYAGPERQPDKTTRERRNDKQQAEGQRLLESTACCNLKIGSNRTGADETCTLVQAHMMGSVRVAGYA